MTRVLFVIGTRPEAIKQAPVILECQKRSDIEVIVCSTGQHRQMLDQALGAFDIQPDIDLELMTKDQSLTDLTASTLLSLGKVLDQHKPDAVVVQGDTTTAMVGSLAAFYRKIPVVHVEAGLRTWDRLNPFPEEVNRAIIDQIADYYMAPTEDSRTNLNQTGAPSHRIWVTGNTSVDAIISMAQKVSNKPAPDSLPDHLVDAITSGSKIITVTGHRRESFGADFESICTALKLVSTNNPKVHIVYPVHLNPKVQEPVFRVLSDIPNVHLIEPLAYPEFVWLLTNSHIVLSDSGGIQEEVPSLDKPVLVIRTVTERPEGVEAGCAKLVGVSQDEIVRNIELLLTDKDLYSYMATSKNPYGDGKASIRIADLIQEIPAKND